MILTERMALALNTARRVAQPVEATGMATDPKTGEVYSHARADDLTAEGQRACTAAGLALLFRKPRLRVWPTGDRELVQDLELVHESTGATADLGEWPWPLDSKEAGQAWSAALTSSRGQAYHHHLGLRVVPRSLDADASGFDAAAKKIAEKRAKNGEPAQAAGYPPLGTIRDAFTVEDLRGSPFEVDQEEEKRETEAKLRAGLRPGLIDGDIPPLPPAPPSNGSHPAVAFDATTGQPPAEKRGEVIPLPITCPVCHAKGVVVSTRCGSCERHVCWKCVTGDRADPGPCTDCNTAEGNADCAPPFLADDLCQKARELLDVDHYTLNEASEAVGVEVLAVTPLGALLRFSGAVFRLGDEDWSRYLRGDTTVGIEEEEGEAVCPGCQEPIPEGHARAFTKDGGEWHMTCRSSSTPLGPTGGVPPEGEGAPSEDRPAPEPAPASTSPAGEPPVSGAGGEPTSPPSSSSPPAPGPSLRCPDCLDEVRDLRAFMASGAKLVAPCPWCETELRLVRGDDGSRWLEVPELHLGLLEHVPTGRKVKYGARRVRAVTVSVLPGADVDTVDVTELRAWEEPAVAAGAVPTKGKGKKEKPGKAPPGPVAIPEEAEARKALGALWCSMKRHTATKKAPEEDCPLCERPLRKLDVYRVGKALLGKRTAHDACVALLLDGKDPRVNERHAIEREAIDRLTPAAAGGEA